MIFTDKKKGGWIKLYRSIWDNWVYSDPEDFRAWVDLLLMANHEDKEIKVNGVLYPVSRGQKLTSIVKLSKRWNWSRKRVIHFLNNLQDANMIYYKSDTRSGTLITIVNYGVYQGNGTAEVATEVTADGTAEVTTEVATEEQQRLQQRLHKQESKKVKTYKEWKEEQENSRSRGWLGLEAPQ